MITKVLELRDKATFIPIMAILMESENEAQRYLMGRVGYISNDQVVMMELSRCRAHSDPYNWGGRTYPVAHEYIIEHFHDLADGDVIDVEYILNETKKRKVSERYTSP